MKWRIYKHQFRFIHSVEDRPELVDKDCLKPHKHGFGHNPPCTMEFIVGTDKWVDFKTITVLANKVLESISNKTENPGDFPVYDFGTQDTEKLTTDVRHLMEAELKEKYADIKVQIWLDETPKYAIWDDAVESHRETQIPLDDENFVIHESGSNCGPECSCGHP